MTGAQIVPRPGHLYDDYNPGPASTSTSNQTSILGQGNTSANVVTFGADLTGVNDSSAAFLAAQAAGTINIPPGIYNTTAALTGSYAAIAEGKTTYTGANPFLSWTPGFGGVLQVASVAANGIGGNAFVAVMRNNLTSNFTSFPTAVTAMGRNDNNGNTVFGIYAPAYQYASTGVANGAEIDSFNMTVAPSTNLPPDRSIGTAQNQPIALTVAAGGNQSSSIGVQICREGSSPQPFLTGIYINPDACTTYGLCIDASASTVSLASLIKHKTGANCSQFQGVGTPNVVNSWLLYVDGNGVTQFGIKESGQLFFSSGNSFSTVGVAGAATVLPSNPTGYVSISVNGFNKKIPYYEP